MNPTPPQPSATTPSSAPPQQKSLLAELLHTLGVGQPHIDTVHDAAHGGDVNKQIDQAHSCISDAMDHAREQAQKNPAAVLGGLSALVIAAGMMRNGLGRR